MRLGEDIYARQTPHHASRRFDQDSGWCRSCDVFVTHGRDERMYDSSGWAVWDASVLPTRMFRGIKAPSGTVLPESTMSRSISGVGTASLALTSSKANLSTRSVLLRGPFTWGGVSTSSTVELIYRRSGLHRSLPRSRKSDRNVFRIHIEHPCRQPICWPCRIKEMLKPTEADFLMPCSSSPR